MDARLETVKSKILPDSDANVLKVSIGQNFFIVMIIFCMWIYWFGKWFEINSIPKGHVGFHCNPVPIKYTGGHLAAIFVPIILVLFGLATWFYRQRGGGQFDRTALVDEDSETLPWEQQENQNTEKDSAFSSFKKTESSQSIKTLIKPVRKQHCSHKLIKKIIYFIPEQIILRAKLFIVIYTV